MQQQQFNKNIMSIRTDYSCCSTNETVRNCYNDQSNKHYDSGEIIKTGYSNSYYRTGSTKSFNAATKVNDLEQKKTYTLYE